MYYIVIQFKNKRNLTAFRKDMQGTKTGMLGIYDHRKSTKAIVKNFQIERQASL